MVDSVRRVSTGIPGFDRLVQGGFVMNSVNMVTGQTGTGKSIFGSQFLWNGLTKGDTGVYITLEQDADSLKNDMKLFGWDFVKYEKKGMCKIIYHDPAQVANLSAAILDEVNKLDAKRLVIDSTAVLSMTLDNPSQTRRRILGIINAVKRNEGLTGLMLSEIPEGQKNLSRTGVEEFVVDSVVVLYYTGIGGEEGSNIEVRKMRRTNHARGFFPLKFSKKGLSVGKEGTSVIMK